VDEESKKMNSIIQNNERKCTCDTKKFSQLVKETAKKYDIDKVYVETKHMTTT
jgi:hypothetical protein